MRHRVSIANAFRLASGEQVTNPDLWQQTAGLLSEIVLGLWRRITGVPDKGKRRDGGEPPQS